MKIPKKHPRRKIQRKKIDSFVVSPIISVLFEKPIMLIKMPYVLKLFINSIQLYLYTYIRFKGKAQFSQKGIILMEILIEKGKPFISALMVNFLNYRDNTFDQNLIMFPYFCINITKLAFF